MGHEMQSKHKNLKKKSPERDVSGLNVMEGYSLQNWYTVVLR